MASYIQYIPQVNSTTYPTSISDAFSALTVDVTAVETGKLATSGGSLSGALTITTGGLTLSNTGLSITAGNINVNSGNIIVSGTVDGRDISIDGTKLDGIETSATADQTGAEIKLAYEGELDTNAYTDAAVTKLNGIETSATADQTGAEIKLAYEGELDTNAYTDAEKTSVGTISALAPLASPTFTGTVNLPLSNTIHVTEKQLSSNPTAGYAVNLNNGSVFELTLSGNTAISFSNIPTTSNTTTVTLILIQDATGSRVPSFPVSVIWDGGTVPTWGTAAGDVDVITLFTYTTGTTWRANLVGQNYA